MLRLTESELLTLQKETNHCSITNPMFEDISTKDSYNEYLKAFKENEKNKKLKRKYHKYCCGNFNEYYVGNLGECKSVNYEDNFNINDHIEDFLLFQFNLQLVRDFEPITLYVNEDESYSIDWKYIEDENVYKFDFTKDNGEVITLNRDMEDVDELIDELIDETHIDQCNDVDLDQWCEDTKKEMLEDFEYEYVCEMIEDFINECLLNHN